MNIVLFVIWIKPRFCIRKYITTWNHCKTNRCAVFFDL